MKQILMDKDLLLSGKLHNQPVYIKATYNSLENGKQDVYQGMAYASHVKVSGILLLRLVWLDNNMALQYLEGAMVKKVELKDQIIHVKDGLLKSLAKGRINWTNGTEVSIYRPSQKK